MCIALPSYKEKYRIWWFDNASMVKDILLARNGKICHELFEKHLDRERCNYFNLYIKGQQNWLKNLHTIPMLLENNLFGKKCPLSPLKSNVHPEFQKLLFLFPCICILFDKVPALYLRGARVEDNWKNTVKSWNFLIFRMR